VKIRLGRLRRLIREAIVTETLGASASGTDPTDHKGFYPYEIERGTDIHGFWYRSPGREPGSDGDPFRPSNAAQYIGQQPPDDNTVNTPGEDAAEDMEAEPIMPGEGADVDGTALDTDVARAGGEK